MICSRFRSSTIVASVFPPRIVRMVILALIVVALPIGVEAADQYLVSNKRVAPNGIDGSLVIAGGGQLPKEVFDLFVKLAGGEKARILIVPTASSRADAKNTTPLLATWKRHKILSLELLHTRSRKTANDAEFVKPLKMATGVWFMGGSQSKIAEAYVGTAVEKELHALLKRGGVIGGSSAGAAIQSRVMIASGNPKAVVETGFDFLPDAIIDQHFLKRKRKPRLAGVLKSHRGRFGIGIDEGTAILVRGRRFQVLGKSTVTVMLAANGIHPAKEVVLKHREIGDLTAFRRAAVSRTLPAFPPKVPAKPNVAKGSLVIVGGGGMPRDICEKFIELAGGPDALIVYLPTAVPDALARRARKPRYFTQAGARNIVVLPQSKLADVESAEFLAVLKKAKGVWFGGGRQWRFIDAYAGTKAAELFHEVLARGGVVGGSSAGASIQGGYLARANPLGNREIMADGYERGLNFLPGVAIDQHFAQRGRFRDMTRLMKRYPQLLGIGIDEATAIVVRGSTATVMGRSRAHFYDRRKPIPQTGPDYESLYAGDTYNLKTRTAKKILPVRARKPITIDRTK
jgi:cyanophycinase